MRTHLGTVVILLAVMMGACAPAPHRPIQVQSPPFYVPTAAIVHRPGADAVSTAGNVLPESDSFVYFARGEKSAWGNTPIYEYSAFSVLTYDVQRISSPADGGGYRYRWGYQSGLSIP